MKKGSGEVLVSPRVPHQTTKVPSPTEQTVQPTFVDDLLNNARHKDLDHSDLALGSLGSLLVDGVGSLEHHAAGSGDVLSKYTA
jgi:hypothetical protein